MQESRKSQNIQLQPWISLQFVFLDPFRQARQQIFPENNAIRLKFALHSRFLQINY